MSYSDINQHSSPLRKNYIRIDGVDQLIIKLRKHLVLIPPSEVRKALTPAANIVVKAARSYAPTSSKPHKFETAKGETVTIQPGNLRRSIQLLPKWSKDPYGLYVGPKIAKRRAVKAAVNGYYAHFVEYGTAAHNLGYKGKYLKGQGANVKGQKPQPYMRPAYDSTTNEVINKMYAGIEKMLFERHI